MTLSYRTLYGFIAAIAVVRFVLISLLLPDGSSHFSDEISYAQLADLISAGGDWQRWNSGEGATLVPANLALLAPASLGVTAGLDALAAVRLVSIILAALAQACFIWIISIMPGAPGSTRRVRVVGWPMLAISAFVLLPGSLFWNSLGLKESVVTLSSLLALAACIVLVGSRRLVQRLLALVVILGCVALQMTSRAYVAPALMLALGVFLAWNAVAQPRTNRARQRMRALVPTIAAIMVLGLIGGVWFLGSAGSPSEKSSLASRVVTSIGVQTPLQHLQALRGIRERTAAIGESGVVMEACTEAPAEGIQTIFCEAFRLPMAAASIITRPAWPIDAVGELSPAWSRFALAVQVDSLASSALLALVIVLAITNRTRSRALAATAVVYFGTVLVGLALIEGNMGTWMRHRLMLLWPLCLLVALVGVPRTRDGCPSAMVPFAESKPEGG